MYNQSSFGRKNSVRHPKVRNRFLFERNETETQATNERLKVKSPSLVCGRRRSESCPFNEVIAAEHILRRREEAMMVVVVVDDSMESTTTCLCVSLCVQRWRRHRPRPRRDGGTKFSLAALLVNI